MFHDRLVWDDGSVYPFVLYKKFEILKLRIKIYLRIKKLTLLAACSSKDYLQKWRSKPKFLKKKITNYNPVKQNKKPKLELKPTQNINQLRRLKKSRRNKSAQS